MESIEPLYATQERIELSVLQSELNKLPVEHRHTFDDVLRNQMSVLDLGVTTYQPLRTTTNEGKDVSSFIAMSTKDI